MDLPEPSLEDIPLLADFPDPPELEGDPLSGPEGEALALQLSLLLQLLLPVKASEVDLGRFPGGRDSALVEGRPEPFLRLLQLQMVEEFCD